ncbi:MAG: SGNH/GDSL hydrolase family protein [Opitutae bacterium]|nr:SGNH/GDSL hydrolase family protein [Opitutae bacterium]
MSAAKSHLRSLRRVAAFAFLTCLASLSAAERWIGTWATAPIAETPGADTPALAEATFRQIVHVSLGGDKVRLRLSNAFGTTPLTLRGVHLARAAAAGAIDPATDRAVTFAGRASVTIPAGASFVSDPLEFPLAPQADVAISLHFAQLPEKLTAHPGARTHSYLQPGDALAAAALPDAKKTTRWYFINGLDVLTDAPHAAALVLLGDSITDGYGTTTDQNNRWPDEFVRRFQAQPDAPALGVLNLGIGGNRLLRDGLGPNALARFDRDVLAQSGARWLLVLEGINDLGTRLDARKKGGDFASADDLIAALRQLVARAHSRGLRVIGATITPYQGADFYFTPDGEADRQTINDWIRHSGAFDAVADFDAALRDPQNLTRLAPEFDCGDHLHPSLAGYARLAAALDPSLFTP